MRTGEGSRDAWSAAARRSAERFGLKVHPEPVFLRWCPSPEAERRRRGTLFFGLVGFMLGLWIVGFPMGSWFFGGEELP